MNTDGIKTSIILRTVYAEGIPSGRPFLLSRRLIRLWRSVGVSLPTGRPYVKHVSLVSNVYIGVSLHQYTHNSSEAYHG